MKARRIATAAVLAVLLAAGSATAEGIEGRFAIAAQVGTQSELGGNLLQSDQGTVAGLPVVFTSIRYRDAYSPKVRVQGFVGYGVSESVEIVLRGGWYKSKGIGLSAGNLAGKEMFAYFTDYEEAWGLELAARYYIAHRSKLMSYIAPVGGVRWTNNIYVSYSAPEAGTAVLNVPFNLNSTVPVFGLDIGVSFDLTTNLFIALDSSLRWQGAPKSGNGLPSLTAVDDSDNRWTAPVMFSVGVRF
jgi:hypothetical protein